MKTSEVKGQRTGAEKVKGHEVKGGQRSGSPQQGKKMTIFSGLRSSLSRLSKTSSHEDLMHETAAATANTTTDAADAVTGDDVRVNDENNRLDVTTAASTKPHHLSSELKTPTDEPCTDTVPPGRQVDM